MRLLTTEPIDTVEQIVRIVDWYRTRWLIEEFFKALKTGCAYEKRQLESLPTLLVALALLAPIAWRLLLLRHLSREPPATAATVALTPRQLQVLRASSVGAALPRTHGHGRPARGGPPRRPSATERATGVARPRSRLSEAPRHGSRLGSGRTHAGEHVINHEGSARLPVAGIWWIRAIGPVPGPPQSV